MKYHVTLSPVFRGPVLRTYSAVQVFMQCSHCTDRILDLCCNRESHSMSVMFFYAEGKKMCGIWIPATAGVVCVYMFKCFLRIQALLGHTDMLSASLNCSGFHIEKYVRFFPPLLREDFWKGHWKC